LLSATLPLLPGRFQLAVASEKIGLALYTRLARQRLAQLA
jgi:hypothetical protein